MLPCMVNRPAGTGDYLFMVFYDHVMVRAADGEAIRPPGTLIIWRPGECQYYGSVRGAWNHSWLHCSGAMIARHLEGNRVPCNTAIPLPSLSDKYLFDIHAEMSGHASPDLVLAGNCLENWIREIARVAQGRQAPHVPPELRDIKAYIESHYDRPLSLTMLARRAGLSVPHLCSQFKRYFGSAVISYVLGLRMSRAVALLQDTTLSVTDVARAVGYDDLYHFSKLVKQRYGLSPRQMRKTTTRAVA